MVVTAITGHRPRDLRLPYDYDAPAWTWLRREIRSAYETLETDLVVTGMALGVDQVAALCAQQEGIPYIAAVPFEGQELQWPEASQTIYHDILFAADDVHVVSPGGYAAWKMHVRNKWMVNYAKDRDGNMLAVWNGKETGGTYQCITYAIERIPVFRIDTIRKKVGPYGNSRRES